MSSTSSPSNPLWLGALAALVLAGCAQAQGASSPPMLRVCSDPNNLPWSNERGEGFENQLAHVLAKELGRAGVEYTWLPQRRAFIRKTLKAGKCDVVMGAPEGYGLAWVTRPYYRSSYVFVTRADRHLDLHSLDDPRLRGLQIGSHAIGDDYANVPPAQALARRGLVDHIVGFPIYGDYARANPPAALIDAVAKGDIDVAIAWGPLAGYFAQIEPTRLVVTPIASDEPGMTFAIGLATRKDDYVLHALLDAALIADRPQIDAVLDRYGVPRAAKEDR